jgi:tetratricopeptide (TPR) repeat protein
VKSIIDRALALSPNSPEAHGALGLFFYHGHRQYEMALTEFNRTLELQPNNALAQQYRGYVYRRRGEWERSLADLQRAQELDPRDAQIPAEIGGTYADLRLWKDAERAELRGLAIDPHSTFAAGFLLVTRYHATGDVDYLRRTFDGFPEDIKGRFSRLDTGGYGSGGGNAWGIIGGWPVILDAVQRHFTDASRALEEKVAKNDRERLVQFVGRVLLSALAEKPEAAKSAGEEALPLLEVRLRERPDDTFAMTGAILGLPRSGTQCRCSAPFQAGRGFNLN